MPIRVEINGQKVTDLGPGMGNVLLGNLQILYFGDEGRSFAVLENNDPLDHGIVPTDFPIVVSFNKREIPPIERFEDATVMRDYLRLIFEQVAR